MYDIGGERRREGFGGSGVALKRSVGSKAGGEGVGASFVVSGISLDLEGEERVFPPLDGLTSLGDWVGGVVGWEKRNVCSCCCCRIIFVPCDPFHRI